MTGWLIFLGVLFLLAVLPLGVTIRYDARGFRLGLLAGPLRFWLDLRGLLEKKPEKPREKAEKKKAVQKQKKEKHSETNPFFHEQSSRHFVSLIFMSET